MVEFTNKAWFERAQRVLPGGVSSPVRSFASVGGTPFFTKSGQGIYLTDIEGNTYLDYIQSYGALIFGHCYPKVIEAINKAAQNGTTYGTPTTIEVEYGELLCSLIHGLEMIRFTSSGTEAAMSAVRLARAATQRDKIVMFKGCYHGHADSFLVGAGSGLATTSIASSKGVTSGQIKDTILLDYNQDISLEKDVACVIVEPIACNMGLVAPKENWLYHLREACDSVGAILIFDEVITGFRLGKFAASDYFKVTPDLWVLGKIIGGGLPIGAFGGRRDLMELLAPVGKVYQAGTLSGNPLAIEAGKAVIQELSPELYKDLTQRVNKLKIGLEEIIGQRGIPVNVPSIQTLIGIFFSSQPVKNYNQAKESVDSGRYKVFFHEMLKQKIALAPGGYEIMFPSFMHDLPAIERTIEAADSAAFQMTRYELST